MTFDSNYLLPFKVMAQSIAVNQSNKTLNQINFYLIHRSISEEEITELTDYCKLLGMGLRAIKVSHELFYDAPITKRYPQEMYYRLLAPYILPEELERVLYLDPDILVINPLDDLWETPLEEAVFAASSHTGMTEFTNNLNRVRLGTTHDYYNSGVILMDLVKARKVVKKEEVFKYVIENYTDLILPDQDVFNALYGEVTVPLNDAVWNYDTRNYSNYLLRSKGKYTIDWTLKNTSILHFCGSNKPWLVNVMNKPFVFLYKHYMTIAARRE